MSDDDNKYVVKHSDARLHTVMNTPSTLSHVCDQCIFCFVFRVHLSDHLFLTLDDLDRMSKYLTLCRMLKKKHISISDLDSDDTSMNAIPLVSTFCILKNIAS